jgi:Arc/MetJ-type ribon-helix-helix transcriptional regulator
VELVYKREFASRSEAMREEVRIKRLSAADKRRLWLRGELVDLPPPPSLTSSGRAEVRDQPRL